MRSDLDRVADELEADRVRLAGRENVEDAAADGELAVLVGRIFAGEAGIDQQLGEIGRRDVLAGPQLDRGGEQPFGRADARQQRRRRGDDDPGRAARERMERPRAGRRDADVRRHPAVRDRLRATETAAPPDLAAGVSPSSAARKNDDVGDGLFEIAVARQDVQHDARAGCACAAAATNSAFAERGQARDHARGTSIPLRVTAVFRTARRFSEVEVATVRRARNVLSLELHAGNGPLKCRTRVRHARTLCRSSSPECAPGARARPCGRSRARNLCALISPVPGRLTQMLAIENVVAFSERLRRDDAGVRKVDGGLLFGKDRLAAA